MSGASRRNDYPNGDVVINNTALYCIRNYSGELKWDLESKEMKFFDLDNLPQNQNDPDLIEIYKKFISEKNKRIWCEKNIFMVKEISYNKKGTFSFCMLNVSQMNIKSSFKLFIT